MRRASGEAEPAEHRRFDAIVVGSGPGGATVSRELARRGKSVLLLERGGNARPRDSLFYLASVIDSVPVADGVDLARAITVGGTSTLYLGSAEFPPLEQFKALGIDLAPALEKTRSEMPLVEPASERLIGKQVRRVAAAARDLDVPWVPTEAMAIDEQKCKGGYSYGAIWRADSFVADAVENGAVLRTRAKVSRVLSDGGRAIGVAYEHRVGRRSEQRQAFADQVVIAAGALATPIILRASGLRNVAAHGFYCDPSFLVMGHVKGLNGGDLFPGCMGTNLDEDGLLVGDGCLPRGFYRGMKLAGKDWSGLFRHHNHIAVGITVRDGRRGSLSDDGRFHKELTQEERQKLDKGEVLARRILEKAGGTRISRTGLSAAHLGGTVSIGEVVDSTLQTEIKGLYVCDNSVLPHDIRLAPFFTLVCLANYLAGVLEERM